jgi:hypothetical protein
MADRDPHGRIVEGGEISKRGPLKTIGTGVTNSMTSPHRSHKTRSKGDWRHHPIMVSLSRTRKPHSHQPFSMLNNTSIPTTPGIDIPSDNLHVKDLLFVELITGMGWSNENQETRVQALLTLSVDKMVKSLQHRQDIILIPRHW